MRPTATDDSASEPRQGIEEVGVALVDDEVLAGEAGEHRTARPVGTCSEGTVIEIHRGAPSADHRSDHDGGPRRSRADGCPRRNGSPSLAVHRVDDDHIASGAGGRTDDPGDLATTGVPTEGCWPDRVDHCDQISHLVSDRSPSSERVESPCMPEGGYDVDPVGGHLRQETLVIHGLGHETVTEDQGPDRG